MLLNIFFYAEGILYRAQSKHLIACCAGNPWLGWLCSRGKNKLIIAFFKFFAGFQILNGNRMFLGMKRNDLMTHLHCYTEPREETLRRLKCQLFRIRDNISYIIRQSAVCIRNIPRTLKYNDFRLFI